MTRILALLLAGVAAACDGALTTEADDPDVFYEEDWAAHDDPAVEAEFVDDPWEFETEEAELFGDEMADELDPDDEESFDYLAHGTLPATCRAGDGTSGRAVRSGCYNRPLQGHNDQCVPVDWASYPRIPLHFAEGIGGQTGWEITPELAKLALYPKTGKPTKDDGDGHLCGERNVTSTACGSDEDCMAAHGPGFHCRQREGVASLCAEREVQLDVREVLEVNGGTYYFHRGGYGYTNPGGVKYGWIPRAMLNGLATIELKPTRVHNGHACAPSKRRGTAGSFRIRPTPLPEGMHFRKSNYARCSDADKDAGLCTNGYPSYGNPSWTQANPDFNGDGAPDVAAYTYMVWSWVNKPQGGVVRTLVGDGARDPSQVFRRCDVKAIRMPTWDDSGRRRTGWIMAVYGGIEIAGRTWYGWMPYKHRYTGDPSVPPTIHRHMERIGP